MKVEKHFFPKKPIFCEINDTLHCTATGEVPFKRSHMYHEIFTYRLNQYNYIQCSECHLKSNAGNKWMVKTTTTTELKTKIRELYLEANPRLHFMLH